MADTAFDNEQNLQKLGPYVADLTIKRYENVSHWVAQEVPEKTANDWAAFVGTLSNDDDITSRFDGCQAALVDDLGCDGCDGCDGCEPCHVETGLNAGCSEGEIRAFCSALGCHVWPPGRG
jgi:hypothetical protein